MYVPVTLSEDVTAPHWAFDVNPILDLEQKTTVYLSHLRLWISSCLEVEHSVCFCGLIVDPAANVSIKKLRDY